MKRVKIGSFIKYSTGDSLLSPVRYGEVETIDKKHDKIRVFLGENMGIHIISYAEVLDVRN